MLCSRCKKRPAVVFVTNNQSKDAPTTGYCLTCAKELGIKPVDDLISKMGISDEDPEAVQDQINRSIFHKRSQLPVSLTGWIHRLTDLSNLPCINLMLFVQVLSVH